MDSSQIINEFAAGRVAFIMHGSWITAGLKKTNPALKFGFTAFPGGPTASKPVGVVLAGTTWMVSATTKNAAAARKYLAFWARPENLRVWNSYGGAFTTLRAGSSDLPTEMQPFAAAVKDNRAINFPFSNWPRADFQDAVFKKGSAGILRGQSAQAVLRTFDQEFRVK